MNDTLASAPHPAIPMETADVSRSHRATLRSMIATWRVRTRFRWELKQMAKDNPHLIDDIGLTRLQAEEEIAKLPFWQR